MRKVVIDMQALFAAAVENALHASGYGFETQISPAPQNTLALCEGAPCDVLIMDVMSLSPRTLEERLEIRNGLKKTNPGCKIVLLVDENGEKKAADKVRLAKKDGLVDDFIYNSASSAYLAAVVDAL